MMTEVPPPPRIVGGGINTGESAHPFVVTQMLGADSSSPVREEALRARFLSFDPLFDATSQPVAHQLVLRGRTTPAAAPAALQQMDEDMLLTGLYSLTQDGLAGALPLLVQISGDVLCSAIPEHLNQPQLIWRVDLDTEQHLARALALQDAGLTFCVGLNPANAVIQESISTWPHLAWDANKKPPAHAPHLIVEGTGGPPERFRWPDDAWFKGSLFSGDTQPGASAPEHAIQFDLLAISLRQSANTLIQFFRLNPEMGKRLLAIANSPVGGLSRPADSAGHALVVLGPQRASRVAALLAIAGEQPTDATRHYAVTALTRALFMGKLTRLGAPAESASTAFEVGLLSIAPHALGLPVETLIRKLGLTATTARALSALPSPEGAMLQLAHACENNDAATLEVHAQKLGIPLHQISVSYLDALIAASALDAALH